MCFSVFGFLVSGFFHAFDYEDFFIAGRSGADAFGRCRMAVFAGHAEVHPRREQLFFSKDC